MKFMAIIPARYASTRYPGKPLAILGGKTVIQRVYEQVKSVLDDVYVATDDDRIYNTVTDFGGKAVMTRADGTLGKPFESIDAVENPNSPKIVTDNRGFALYFSRSIIPYIRGKERDSWFGEYPFLKHLGIYAYRREVLAEVTKLPMSSLEKAESLEQLRWLQNGYRIRVGLTDIETVGIDTPEDLTRAEEFLLKHLA